MHFLDAGLVAYLAGWTNPAVAEHSAMAGQLFETFAFTEIYKSFTNAGQAAPLYFFRTNDKQEIDILMDTDGTLFPIEVKKSTNPNARHAKNFSALNPVAAEDFAPELHALKRTIGTGCIVSMASDARPINERLWTLPIWAI